jgi:hypothetical protein
MWSLVLLTLVDCLLLATGYGAPTAICTGAGSVPLFLYQFYRSASRSDLVARTNREGVSLHGEGNIEIALAEHLDPAALLDEPSFTEIVWRDRRAGIEVSETLNVYDGELDPVRVREPLELGYATLEGCLTTLKALTDLASCLQTLRPAASRLTTTSALTATYTDLALL